LKTPIASIGLLAEALDVAAAEPDQVRRFAGRLTAESGRLARLTQEIIELSRLQAQDALEHPQLVDIDSVVAQAVDQARTVADADGVTLIVGPASGTQVYGDESMLVVAVHNLVANAVLYSSGDRREGSRDGFRNGSRVGVGVRAHEGVVEIAVTDQGVGIPEADLDRVFERFFRVDQARSRHTGGSGLGLAIVKHVVQNHGGDVRVWSQEGRGSTFTIRLPLATDAPATDAPATDAPPPDAATPAESTTEAITEAAPSPAEAGETP
jgi:two-component system sensor histidine kinase SenX3